MDNPRNEVSKARKEDLLARTMKRLDARQQGPSQGRSQRARGTSPNGSDEVFIHLSDCFDNIRLIHGRCSEQEDSSGPEFEDLEVYSDQIFEKYPMNTKYNRHYPVYLDPTNPDRYILLTSGNVDIWAKDLCSRVPGVSLVSPPSSIKYQSRKQTEKEKAPSTVESSSTASLVELTKWLIEQKNGMPRSSPPSSVCGDTTTTVDIGDYLNFVCIAPNKREGIRNTLLHNDIDCYKMFKNLVVDDLKALGFNVGIITKLRSNVTRYRAHLARSG
ncbi:uncharacterized protein PGTG_03456 [Puccinia graminis f. sp. tritici CRL 75-36-700-3]|nr:uncharacterized protein PGTG_03456 [Puccinia graminis f. sp. tritici CRL 75-36-700-3]EFP77500.2 hypothetical protein PGTG_03456 [Puccinia graminis f. sp. tritici CRL 75-36-700-3]